MKIIKILILLAVVVFLFPKAFISSPGYTTEEYAQEFEKTKKHCVGFSYLKNASEMAADAQSESLCFGWLK